MIWEADIGFGVASVKPHSADFPTGLPLLAGGATPFQPQGYLDKKNKDVAKRLKYPTFELMEKLRQYQNYATGIHNDFKHMYDQYDREIILPTTTALGIVPPSHTDVDELGTLGRNNDFEYSQDTVAAVKKYYSKYMQEYDGSYSLPRGKNTAYPIIIPGLHREVNDIALAAQVALASAAKSRKWSLPDLFRFLQQYHGQNFTIYGERRQHVGKTMPMSLSQGIHFGKMVEARVRGIYMSPKVAVAYNRRTVKKALATILATPVHVQDRPTIQNIMNKGKAAGKEFIAVDFSKFDQQFGNKRGRQVLRIISDLFGVDAFYDDLDAEFSSPLITFRQGQAYRYSNAPILMSGASFTSVVGCIGNVLSTVEMLSHYFGTTPADVVGMIESGRVLYIAWGDDTVLALDKGDHDFEKLQWAYDKVKMKVDKEPVIKYLGNVYFPDAIKDVRTGYSLGRAIQQQFFPERKKTFPFSTIGYVARLTLMEKSMSKEFHSIMLKRWVEEDLGPRFKYEDKEGVVRNLMPEAQKKAARIAELDDILMSLTHGVDDIAFELDPELAGFKDLLGLTSADFSDPLKFWDEEVKASSTLKGLFTSLLKGELNDYPRFLTQLVVERKLTWKPGEPVY